MIEILKKNISIKTLFSSKFLAIFFITGVVGISLMKLIVKQFPNLNEVIAEILIYGVPALLITFLAVWLEFKIR